MNDDWFGPQWYAPLGHPNPDHTHTNDELSAWLQTRLARQKPFQDHPFRWDSRNSRCPWTRVRQSELNDPRVSQSQKSRRYHPYTPYKEQYTQNPHRYGVGVGNTYCWDVYFTDGPRIDPESWKYHLLHDAKRSSERHTPPWSRHHEALFDDPDDWDVHPTQRTCPAPWRGKEQCNAYDDDRWWCREQHTPWSRHRGAQADDADTHPMQRPTYQQDTHESTPLKRKPSDPEPQGDYYARKHTTQKTRVEDGGDNKQKALATLQLPLDATLVQIRKQYHILSLRLHPDKQPSNLTDAQLQAKTKEFQEVSTAYALLSDGG
jgi:hypothetical protein